MNAMLTHGVLCFGWTFVNAAGSTPSWANVNRDRAPALITAVAKTMKAVATVRLTT